MEKLAEFPIETFSATVDDEFTYTYYKSDSLADCKITVNPSFFLTQTESTDMGDGNTRVSFATPAEFDGKTRIEQVLENDRGVLSRFYTTVDINPDCVGSAVTLELADGKDYSRWNGVLKISNESNVNVAKGYVEFTSPESFAKLGKIAKNSAFGNGSNYLSIQSQGLIEGGTMWTRSNITPERINNKTLKFTAKFKIPSDGQWGNGRGAAIVFTDVPAGATKPNGAVGSVNMFADDLNSKYYFAAVSYRDGANKLKVFGENIGDVETGKEYEVTVTMVPNAEG